jgi:alpha-tubulin suppressor-like RCC1 family protein
MACDIPRGLTVRSIRLVKGSFAALLVSTVASAAVALSVPGSASAAGHAVMRWGSFGTPPGSRTPALVEGLTNVTAIDASNASAYALESNGTVWAWGNNDAGELGVSGLEESPEAAVQVPLPAGVTITSIGEAEFDGIAIDKTGHAWAWGNGGPTACLGELRGREVPPTEVPGISNAVAVQGGGHHTIWLLANGTVEACGGNAQGQLGVSGIEASGTPVQVPGLSNVVEISAAERTSCARTASGAVYDWGANWDGQIGNGKISEGVFAPYHVPLPGPASEVSCGGNVATNDYTLAVVGGQVYGWGADGAGQIGDRSTAVKPSPVATGLHFSYVVASGGTSYGLDASGEVWSWGTAFEGALGTGSGKNALVPHLVDEHVVAISATAHDAIDLHY